MCACEGQAVQAHEPLAFPAPIQRVKAQAARFDKETYFLPAKFPT